MEKCKDKKRWIRAACIIVLSYLAVHGYHFTHTGFAGDSLLMISQNDAAWQIALGRFVQPVLVMLRGGLESPFLISGLTMLWLIPSLYFLTEYLEINSLLGMVLTGCMMSGNTALIAANASFMPWSDFYAFALFLAIFGIWLIGRKKLLCGIAGALLLAVSMGIYQAYICVALGLGMLGVFRRMDKQGKLREELLHILRMLICFAGAAGVYYLVWKLFQKVFHIWTADSYNGLAGVGDYSGYSLIDLLGQTYRNVWEQLVNPAVFTTMDFRGHSLSIVWSMGLRCINLLVLVLIFASAIRGFIKNQTAVWQKVLQGVILVLFPFGINAVCFISKGMEHSLMTYAFFLIYVAAILFWENGDHVTATEKEVAKRSSKKAEKVLQWLLTFCIGILFWNQLVYANQIYLKRDLQERAALSLMTRIVYEIEDMDGYEPGVTPVAFYGSFETTDYMKPLEGFEELICWGMGKSSLTYIGTDYAYLRYILNVNMNLVRADGMEEELKALPRYPAKGSVSWLNGMVVVKISDL